MKEYVHFALERTIYNIVVNVDTISILTL